jgi:hypothetical protein
MQPSPEREVSMIAARGLRLSTRRPSWREPETGIELRRIGGVRIG